MTTSIKQALAAGPTPGEWIAVHRGTGRDIERGTDYYRVGPSDEVCDPEARCVHVFGHDKQARAEFIVKAVNSYAALSASPAPEAVGDAMSIEDYVDGYCWRGDEGDYTPNESEKALLIDALHGAIGVVAHLSATPTPPAQAGEVGQQHVEGLEKALRQIATRALVIEIDDAFVANDIEGAHDAMILRAREALFAESAKNPAPVTHVVGSAEPMKRQIEAAIDAYEKGSYLNDEQVLISVIAIVRAALATASEGGR